MTRYVALLRGINVGGNNKVPMVELRALCTDLGWRHVQSYIASGNLVFAEDGRPEQLSEALRAEMAARFGVDVQNLVLTAGDFLALRATCPFAPDSGKAVHGIFCHAKPKIDQALCDALIGAKEAFEVVDRVAWLHAPDGIARSKLMEKIDKVITGTTITARNLNTINKIAEMLDSGG